MTTDPSVLTFAVVIEEPERMAFRPVSVRPPGPEDVVVEVDWSGVSTGTERLLWTGRMPPFPGLGYPLVPGYESVGRVVDAGEAAKARIGEIVFAPGSTGFVDVRGLFGGAARRIVTASSRVIRLPGGLGETGVLLALAATARHAIAGGDPPDLIVGHGVLGRLMARLCVAAGASPTVWETRAARRLGAEGYRVIDPGEDPRRDYPVVCDVSGDAGQLGELISRIARGGEVILAGFYDRPLSFDFPPAFMKEARLRVAAEWAPDDLVAVAGLIASGALSLEGLITHWAPAATAPEAYAAAFSDPDCLKLVFDWREVGPSTVQSN